MNTDAPYILVIGSATCDMFIGCDAADITPSILDGIKIGVTTLHHTAGGGCINASRALLRLGHRVVPFFKTGRDQTGRIIRAKMEALGLDTSHGQYDNEAPTGTSFIIPTPSKTRTIFAFRGANELMNPSELDENLVKNAAGIYLAPLSQKSLTLLDYITTIAQKQNIEIMHNPSSFELSKEWKTLAQALAHITICCINLREAQTLFAQMFPGKPFDLKTFCQHLHQIGVKTVIITRGSEGAHLSTGQKLLFLPKLEVPVHQTVGAGDVFGATYLGTLLQGDSPENAFCKATLQSAVYVSGTETHPTLLTAPELADKMSKENYLSKIRPV